MALSIGELVAYLRADDTKLAAGLEGAKGKLKSFGEGAKVALGVAGAAAAAAIGTGIAQNLDIGAGRAKLAAQLNLTTQDSDRIGKVAGAVYANNWGDSLDDVNAAIKAVGNNLGNVSRMSSKDLQGVTQNALALASTFDVDVNDSTRAVGQLMKNGLAKNATEAFDIVTRGFQLGLDKSGDFLDTLNEYSPQFAKLGIDGAHALTIMRAGLQAGARDTDTIADAFKEFSLRAIDGSTQTAQGFKDIGLDAKTAAADIAKGGPAAQAMTMKVLQQLDSIKDPIKQNAAGVALFGTQWEDTLRRILPAVAGAEEGMDGVTGATQRMADTAGGSAKAKIETLKRGFEQWIQAQTNSSSALGTTVAAVASFGGPALAMGGSLGQVASGLAAMNLGTAASVVWSGIVRGATLAWTGVQWLLNAALTANPIGLVVLAIAALVAIVIVAWKNSETFRSIVIGAWNAIKAAAVAVWGWLGGFISGVWSAIKSAALTIWGWITGYIRLQVGIVLAVVRGISAVASFIRNAFRSGYNAAVNLLSALVNFVRGIPGRIVGAIANLNSLMYSKGRAIIQSLIDGLRSMAGSVGDAVSGIARKAAGFFPGSPVKEGPLRVLNNGRAGRAIASMIADGLSDSAPMLRSSFASVMPSIPAPRVGGVPGAGVGVAAGAGRQPSEVVFRGEREVVNFVKGLVARNGGGDVQLAFGSKR